MEVIAVKREEGVYGDLGKDVMTQVLWRCRLVELGRMARVSRGFHGLINGDEGVLKKRGLKRPEMAAGRTLESVLREVRIDVEEDERGSNGYEEMKKVLGYWCFGTLVVLVIVLIAVGIGYSRAADEGSSSE